MPAGVPAGDRGRVGGRYERETAVARHPNISDHGLIGDLQTAALVTTDGTVDFFCCPRFDSPSAFASLLNAEEDGYFFAFTATAVTIASCILAIFVDLYPNVMVSSTSSAYNLTVHNTASSHYSLTALTVVVVIFLPLVLLYQAWTYYVFRRRVSRSEFAHVPEPRTSPEPDGATAPQSPLATSDRRNR
jgi:hypothetical protein